MYMSEKYQGERERERERELKTLKKAINGMIFELSEWSAWLMSIKCSLTTSFLYHRPHRLFNDASRTWAQINQATTSQTNFLT